MKKQLLTLLLLLAGCFSQLEAQIIRVPEDYSTIQAGIDAALDGDTLLVGEDTYQENIDFKGKAITVASYFIIDEDPSHISTTIIDGSSPSDPQKGSVVTITNVPVSKATLTGFTITGGAGTYFSPVAATYGGGIFILGCGAIIENNIVRNNSINESNCSVSGIAAILSKDDTLLIRYNEIIDNEVVSAAMTSGALGFIAAENATVRIHDNIISRNIATSSVPYKAVGGGMYIETEYSYGADIQVYNNWINNNELHCQSSMGGGVYVVYNKNHPVPWTTGQVKIFNNLIFNNYSEDKGGGIGVWNMSYERNGLTVTPLDPVIYNNTLYNNFAEEGGSGIFNFDANTLMFNNILWDNISGENGNEIFQDSIHYCHDDWPYKWCYKDNNDGVLHLYNNCIKGGWKQGWEQEWQGTWEGGGNIDTDPYFEEGTFLLSEGSGCIGKGAYSINVGDSWHLSSKSDFLNQIRPAPVDHWIDIGAIESEFSRSDRPTLIMVQTEISSVQSAIEEANTGDTILVSEGTYYENINFKGKAITVASLFLMDGETSHISRTIIDGSQPALADTASVVTMDSGEDTTSVLCGFTITNGQGTYFDVEDQIHRTGGGIFINSSGGKIVSNIIEKNNLDLSSHAYKENAGVGIAARVNNHHQLIIRDNIIRDNNYDDQILILGGGMILGGGPVLVENNIISYNLISSDIESSGAGIFYYPEWVDTTATNEITIRNNKITYNKVSGTGTATGAGIKFRGVGVPSDIQAYNNIIAYNESDKYGGGISVLACDPIIFNNTIYNNKGQTGSQLYNMEEGTPYLFNNILWSDTDNTVIEKLNGTVTATYCDIRGGFTGDGNIDSDPLVDLETFELQEGSPCIGMGTDSMEIDAVWYKAPASDLSGNPRPDPIDTHPDIGALESPFVVGIEEKQSSHKTQVAIYPNPSTGIFTLQLDNPSYYSISITSITGQMIFSEEFTGREFQVDLSAARAGIYFITVRTDKISWTGKVMKH